MRTDDAEDEDERQQTDERAPVRDDQVAQEVEEARPDLVQVVDDGHGGILAPRPGEGPGGSGRAGARRRSGRVAALRVAALGRRAATRAPAGPCRLASRASGRPGSPPIAALDGGPPVADARAAGGRGRPTLGAASRGRARRRTIHEVPSVAAPRVRRSWARRPSSVTTRSAGVGLLAMPPVASMTSRRSSASAVSRPRDGRSARGRAASRAGPCRVVRRRRSRSGCRPG